MNTLLTGLFQDLKFGARMMARNPWLTFGTVLTLALGIGINSTVFSLANAVLFKDLPFQNPREIVHIGMTNTPAGRYMARMSYPEFTDFRARSKTIQSLAAFALTAFDIADSSRPPQRYTGLQMSSNLFSFLGISPVRGRDFTSEDEKAGAEPVTLIGYGVWQERYGGDEDIIGRTIRVNAVQARIVGVMPPGMGFPDNESIWMPFVPGPYDQRRDYRHLDVIGRLASGTSMDQAQTELNAIAQQFARDYPETNKGREAAVLSYLDWSDGPELQTIFLTMLGAVAFVLLIACGNVANLLLSRIVQRSRETSIRTALGASRWRIVRQFLTESVMLSLLGGTFGLLLAQGGIRWFEMAVADVAQKPYWADFSMDYRVFAYFLFICVASGLFFGSVPALQLSKTNVNDNLKEGGRGTAGGFRARRLATVLLIGEIALTVVLLAGAGLLIHAFLELKTLDMGFDTRQLITAGLRLPETRYANREHQVEFVERLIEGLQSIPGTNTAIASNIPLRGALFQQFELRDRDIADANNNLPQAGVLPVDHRYFRTLGLSLTQGRDFDPADGRPGAEVAIVNEAFAAKYWPGEVPVGKLLRLGGEASPWVTVVGVSPAVYQIRTTRKTAVPVVYVPFQQNPVAEFSVLMQTTGERGADLAALRAELAKMDPDLPLFDITTIEEYLYSDMWPQRVIGTLFTAFAVVALMMSSIGLYGVTAYGVTQRTQEIGVRVALGATPLKIAGLILRQALQPIVIGLAIGLFGAMLVSSLLQELLYEVTPTDPLTFVSISILLAAVTVSACVVPARRATRLHPADALRTE